MGLKKMKTKKERINYLKTRYEELANKKYAVVDLAFGTIQMREGICGKPNCKCKKGRPHGPYPYLAFSSKKKGKAISLYISRTMLPIIEKKLKNFQKLKEDIEDLIKIGIEIKKIEQKRAKKE